MIAPAKRSGRIHKFILICITPIQNQYLQTRWTEKSPEKYISAKGTTHVKEGQLVLTVEFDLFYVKTNSYTKFQVNILIEGRESDFFFFFFFFFGIGQLLLTKSARRFSFFFTTDNGIHAYIRFVSLTWHWSWFHLYYIHVTFDLDMYMK